MIAIINAIAIIVNNMPIFFGRKGGNYKSLTRPSFSGAVSCRGSSPQSPNPPFPIHLTRNQQKIHDRSPK